MTEVLTRAAALLAIFAGLGFAIDRLLTPRQKKYFFNRLEDFWFYLDGLEFTQLPSGAAKAFFAAERLIAGRRLVSISGILRTLSFSVFLTTTMFFAGQSLAFAIPDLLNGGTDHLSVAQMLSASWLVFSSQLDYFRVYTTNFVFDLLTILATVFAVSKISKSNHVTFQLAWIVLDMSACIVFFYACFFVLLSGNNLYLGGGATIAFGDFYQWLYNRITHDNIAVLAFWFIPQIFFTSTVFYPTILYLSCLLGLAVLFIIAHITKIGGLQISELSSLGDKTIFFYGGTVLGATAAIINLALFFLTG